MLSWDLETTDYAKDSFAARENGLAKDKSFLSHYSQKAFGDARWEENSSRMIKSLQDLADNFHSHQVANPFTQFIDETHDIWANDLYHEKDKKMLINFLGANYNESDYAWRSARLSKHLVELVSSFYYKAFRQDEATVVEWIKRVDDFASLPWSSFESFFSERYYSEEINMEDVRELFGCKRLYIFHAIDGLKAGFTVAEIKKLNSAFYRFYYFGADKKYDTLFSPAEVRELMNKYPVQALNAVVQAVILFPPDAAPPLEHFEEALGAGFNNIKTLKLFARRTGIDLNDREMLHDVAQIRKRLTEEQSQILMDKQANVIEIAKIVATL